MPRRLLIIANPIAGGGKARQAAAALRTALGEDGGSVELHYTMAKGDARRRAAATATDGPWDALAVVGGDGTVNEVLNGLPDPSIPLAVLPMGTANVLATELGLPAGPAASAAMIRRGRTVGAALGAAGDRRFLLFAGAGLDGAMVRRLEQVRKGTLGKLRWTRPVGHVLWHWPRFDLTVSADGRTFTGITEALVTRVRNYGAVFHLPGAIDIADGRLHLLLFRQRSRRAWFLAALRAALGRLRPGRDVEMLTADEVAITPGRPDGDLPVQVDGDHHGTGPVHVRRLDAQARLLRP